MDLFIIITLNGVFILAQIVEGVVKFFIDQIEHNRCDSFHTVLFILLYAADGIKLSVTQYLKAFLVPVNLLAQYH